MAAHSSIPAWRIPRTEELDGQFCGSNWPNSNPTYTFPSHPGRGSFVLCIVSTSFALLGHLSWIVPLQASPTPRGHLQSGLIPAHSLGRSSALWPRCLPGLLGRGLELNQDCLLRRVRAGWSSGNSLHWIVSGPQSPLSTCIHPRTQTTFLRANQHTDIFCLNFLLFHIFKCW